MTLALVVVVLGVGSYSCVGSPEGTTVDYRANPNLLYMLYMPYVPFSLYMLDFLILLLTVQVA